MRYYIIAGEASGDLHGGNLIKEIKNRDSEAQVRCWGGEQMQQQGAELVMHYEDLAFMGFKEVFMNLSTILKNLKFCKRDIQNFNPDVIVLIDYPGFNLRIAKFAKQAGFKVIYYISPQLWAWKESRVKLIRNYVDLMIVILPFEKEFYTKHGVDVTYVGHPLLDVIKRFRPTPGFREKNHMSDKPLIALLPGSRKQEISNMLPVMMRMRSYFPEYEFVIARAPGVPESFYKDLINDPGIKIVFDQTYDLFSIAEAGLVTSGTATLEAALFKLPEVVCYKGSNLSYQIAKRLVKVKYISLVNLIMERMIVKELIQEELTEDNLKHELTLLLFENKKLELLEDYKILEEKLGIEGASANAADAILNFLRKM